MCLRVKNLDFFDYTFLILIKHHWCHLKMANKHSLLHFIFFAHRFIYNVNITYRYNCFSGKPSLLLHLIITCNMLLKMQQIGISRKLEVPVNLSTTTFVLRLTAFQSYLLPDFEFLKTLISTSNSLFYFVRLKSLVK